MPTGVAKGQGGAFRLIASWRPPPSIVIHESEKKMSTDYFEKLKARADAGEFKGDLAALAAVMPEIWSADVETCPHCHDRHVGFVGVVFSSLDDAEEFLAVIGDQTLDDGELYSRLTGASADDHLRWQFELHLVDGNGILEGDVDSTAGVAPQTDMLLYPAVWFPLVDLAEVRRRIEIFAESRAADLGAA